MQEKQRNFIDENSEKKNSEGNIFYSKIYAMYYQLFLVGYQIIKDCIY